MMNKSISFLMDFKKVEMDIRKDHIERMEHLSTYQRSKIINEALGMKFEALDKIPRDEHPVMTQDELVNDALDDYFQVKKYKDFNLRVKHHERFLEMSEHEIKKAIHVALRNKQALLNEIPDDERPSLTTDEFINQALDDYFNVEE